MDESMEECVFAERGFPCVWYQCDDCSWYSHSADPGWSKRAGEVHAQILCPGHRVTRWMNPHEDPREPVGPMSYPMGTPRG